MRRPRTPREDTRIFWFPPSGKWVLRFGALPKGQLRDVTFVMKAKWNVVFAPDSNAWVLDESSLSDIEAFLARNNINVRREEKPNFVPPVIAPRGPDYWAVFRALTGLGAGKPLMADAKRAYRLAAARLHPDRGGDSAKMCDLNVAWDNIQKDLT